jgi:cyclopropane fatty-acyl-phospholipid synthase-like methyltransferase
VVGERRIDVTLRERVLSDPRVYKTFKRLVLPGGTLERLVAEHFQVDDGGRVLDLGCGFGDYAPYFAGRVDYLGIDHNESYIDTAKRMNAGGDARFMVADVADPVVAEHGPFDLVMISGELHHLPPESITALAELIRPLLSPSGRLVAMEPVFDPINDCRRD